MALSRRKNHRFDLRATAEQKTVIDHAALLRQTSATNFILDTAYEAAQKVIRDQYHFVLNKEQWEAFCQALEAPPKANPRLRKLMSVPEVWED